MKLERITIINFRQYYGEQTVRLSQDTARNVTIFHGVNGAGKTSFFAALSWCLYGEGVDGIGQIISKEAVRKAEVSEEVRTKIERTIMEHTELVAAARAQVGQFALAREWLTAGSVAAALVTEAGNLYTGICLDLACGVGFCAEHAAVAAMLLQRETVITAIVAVTADAILPPCGRCRELLLQVDRRNLDCTVILPTTAVPLRGLLPNDWLSETAH